MKKQNIFADIPAKLPNEIFDAIVSKEGVKIERIVSCGHTSPEVGWYDQEQNEWVLVLSGEAVLSFENKEDVRLASGEYINIPAHTKHKVSWTTPNEKTIWLAVFY